MGTGSAATCRSHACDCICLKMGYPNCEGKERDTAIISPGDSLKYQKKHSYDRELTIPERVILTYLPASVDYLLSLEDGRRTHYITYGLSLLTDGTKGINLTGIGATTASMAMEELIALGSRKFINVGLAGSLQSNLQTGDIVVCDSAIRDEGVSHHYLEPGKLIRTSQLLTEQLKQALVLAKIDFSEGIIWTIATPYRETTRELELYQKEGVLAVELETAALAAVAQYRGVEFASVMVVSDLLASGFWVPKFHEDIVLQRLNSLHRIALSVL